MSKGKVYTVIPSAARTATFNHDLEGLAAQYDEMAIYLNVTAASGTSPTLDVVYQTSNDGGTTWFTHTSMTQATTTTTERVAVTRPIGIDSRILCTIGGTTPSFTFSVACECKSNGV